MKKICILSLLLLPLLASCVERQVYIVYFGEHSGKKTLNEIEENHHYYLFSVKKTEEEARASLLYSYKNSINGFAAVLTPNEASKLSEMEEVVSVIRSHPTKYTLHTTRSWEFAGLEEATQRNQLKKGDLLMQARYGQDVIVGLLDNGVWPESKSFNDEEMGPIPKSWKGICQTGDAFNSTHCNKKLIGARFYLRGYEQYYGPLNTTIDYRSPRDKDGHGTHTASTVGGRRVPNVSALGGFASGIASGGGPLAHLSIYKVCWAIPGKGKEEGNTCFPEDMLAAIDDAIADGVQVMSISIGSTQPMPYKEDGIAIGAFHAMKNNIVVACSAGNEGPGASTLSNPAPWIITVGASSVDRTFAAHLQLGNGMTIKGETVTPYKLQKKMYPLVYAAQAVNPDVTNNYTAGLVHRKCFMKCTLMMVAVGLAWVPCAEPTTNNEVLWSNDSSTDSTIEMTLYGDQPLCLNDNNQACPKQCLPGSLSPEKAKGKIVLCLRGNGTRVKKGKEVKRAGGVGFILGNIPANGVETPVDAHVLPATAVSSDNAIKILNYINSTKTPVAYIFPAKTVLHSKPAPSMAAFSSRGPSIISPDILKPDITAPGLNILAAWSEASSPTRLEDDQRVVKYNIYSGTSMSCPHVAGAAALLKAIHPSWSSAAIRSALITSAGLLNNEGKLITDESGNPANPFQFGSGHFRPTKAADPGLVYDASYTDYLLFLCSSGIPIIDSSFKCPTTPPAPNNLNYPSIAIPKLNGAVTVNRTVTNVGGSKSVYFASVKPPLGFSVKVSPPILFFDYVGQKKNFTITVEAEREMLLGMIGQKDKYSFGWFTWTDGLHIVRSPMAVSLA